MTPTQRTLAELKRLGWTAQVVERWNPYARVRVDLFGCIDIVAITPEAGTWTIADGKLAASESMQARIVGIQCTSGSGHSARRAKIAQEPRMWQWLATGARLEIWSWSKKGARGKRKTWQLRVEAVTEDLFTQARSAA